MLSLNYNFFAVLFIRSPSSTMLHFFYIGHLLWNQLESTSFGLLFCLASTRLKLILGGVLFFHLHPSGFLDLLGHESAQLKLIHCRPSPLISSSRADSGLGHTTSSPHAIFPSHWAEGYRVWSSQILGFQLYTQFSAIPVYAVRVRIKCPYYLDIATLIENTCNDN